VEKKISIITPVFNGSKYIEATINSVLSQTYQNIEYIIVDGGSTDGTKELIEKYRNHIDKIIYQNDNSMYEAIETGLNLAAGEYFHWLNSDDFLLDQNSVKRLMDTLNVKKYEWIICRIAISKFQEKPKIYIPLVYPRWIIKNGYANNCFWGFLQQENTVFSKKLYLKAGGIDNKFKMAGDYDLWKRFAKYEKLVSLKIKFACYRKNDNQLTVLKKYYTEIKKKQCLFNIFYPLRFIVSVILYLYSKNNINLN